MFKSIRFGRLMSVGPTESKEIKEKYLLYFLGFVLSIAFLSGCGSSDATSKVLTSKPISKVLPELKSLGINLSNSFTDGEGAYTYSIASNTNPSVATASIDDTANSFSLNFLNVGTSDISITESFADSSATLVLRVTISEPAPVEKGSLETQTTLADVSIELVNSFPASKGLIYTVGSNSNPQVVTASLVSNTLKFDFLGSGITTITLVESNANGTTTGLVGAFTLTATSNDPCVPDNTAGNCDRDKDNLTNAQETKLGTDPSKADTDGDGTNDGAEVGNDVSNPTDTDGDGQIDALESSTNDTDDDGTNDQEDSDDADPCVPDANAKGCNTASIAKNQAVRTVEDIAKTINLMADDSDEDTLTFSIVAQPQNGGLTGTAPTLTYTPAANFTGQDTFTFKVNDGKSDSNTATVTITVTEVNDAPTAIAQSVTTDEDTAKQITLTGNDVDGDDLSYTVIQQPEEGTLLGTVPNLRYVPGANFNGSDSFTFKVDDGTLDSTVVIVSITVSSVNDIPIADSQTVAVIEDTAKTITLTGNDIEGSTLSFSVVEGPSNGSLTGTAPNLTYTPNENYSGSDSFTFKANDSTADSVTATVSITVSAVNDAPTATAQSITTDEDISKLFTLTGTDVDGDTLNYMVVQQPANGSIQGDAPNVGYIPGPNFNGSDSFTFKVNDGTLDSTVATVTITVNAINDIPVVTAQTVAVVEDTAKTITLTGSDIEGSTLSFSVVEGPSNGSLTGAAPNLTYTPNENYNGSDSFTFKANDGAADSTTATISIIVSSVNDAPVATAQAVTTNENEAKQLTLSGTDDGPISSYSIVQRPSNGSLSGTGSLVTYTPNANYSGTDSFTFKVNDGVLDSQPATVSITVVGAPKTGIFPESSTCASAAVNETCTVTISLQNNDQTLNGFGFKILDTPESFTLASATVGSLPAGCNVVARPAENAIVGLCFGSSFSGNGELATISLVRVQAGDVSFTVDTASINALSGGTTSVEGGTLAVTAVTP